MDNGSHIKHNTKNIRHLGKHKRKYVGQRVLHLTSKVWSIKGKIDKLKLSKLKLCSVKNPKIKKQIIDWEKTFANPISDRGLIRRMCEEFLKLSINKTNNLARKQAKNMNRYFTEENTQMTSKPMERSSTSLAFRNIEIKIIISLHSYRNG